MQPGLAGLRKPGTCVLVCAQPPGPYSRPAACIRVHPVRLRNAALINARFDAAFLTCGPPPCPAPSITVPAGNKLPSVPARTGFMEAKYHGESVEVGVQVRIQSALFVDDRNTDHAPGYVVINLAAGREFMLRGRRARAFVRLDNMLDRRFAGSVIVNEANSRFFEPAPGRTWLVGMDARL